MIAISGKIGSGKDTVGKIIQYLDYCTRIRHHYPIDSFVEDIDANECEFSLEDTPWQIKKFAGKLKQCVSIITGISLEDLEKQSVKGSSLGEDWIRYGYADGFIRKYIGNGIMSNPIMEHKDCSKEEYIEHRKINWQTAYMFENTVRSLLQQLGTEVGRNIHPNFWINALFADYKPINSYEELRSIEDGKEVDLIYPKWIITDLRFPNELEAVKKRGGITIRVNREDFEKISIGEEVIKLPIHTSETALYDATFDYTINNNGSIEELVFKVKEILVKENIIK